jgi:hypothetical protein
MRVVQAVVVSTALALIFVANATAQQQVTFGEWTAPFSEVASAEPSSTTVPDSVRRKVGYQHWKGATIGATVGAVLGSVLAFGIAGRCADCTITTWDRAQAALVITGVSSALGFLAGLASPKYVWQVPLEPSGSP